MNRLNAKQLRTTMTPDIEKLKTINKHPIYIVLDNVLDTYNVGAIFRLADATACQKIFLCGQTESPPNPRIKKASVNTWQWVEWEYSKSAIDAVQQLRSQVKDIKIVAIEQNNNSKLLNDFKPEFPICIIVGNESYGVSEDLLKITDSVVELPMFGINNSLNVMVCLGIVLYRMTEYL